MQHINGWIIFFVAIIIIGILFYLLYRFGDKQQKKQAEARQQMYDNMQVVSMLVIDKGRMKIKEAGFPSIVLENTPKYLRRSKVAVVKAKVGPKIMTFMCDDQVFPLIPVKKEIKATISGIYITGAKGVRGPLETPKKKKGFLARAKEAAMNSSAEKNNKKK